MTTTRRTVLLAGAAASATALMPATAMRRRNNEAEAVLDRALKEILTAYPESATSAGVDSGKYRRARTRLTDRSPEGQVKIATTVKKTLSDLSAINTSDLDAHQALNVDVVKTVYELAEEGFDFPYGDVAVLNSNWSYRNSPYCVAQNVGAFVEIPTFLGSSHKIEDRKDAEAMLDRLEAYASQLDGETERSRLDAEKGVVLPDFLMAKTIGQLKAALDTPVEQWGLIADIASRTEGMRGKPTERATEITTKKIRPAVERQIEELKKQAANATSNAGVWALPDGDAYYDWALRAGTTTTMSPDEIHEMGKSELADLHGRMDPILRSIGYTEGSVGDRMTALGNDPRYKFADGDEGRAEIMAFIEEKVEEIRALMPQAFETLVPGFLEVTRIPPDVEAGAPGAYGGAGTVDGKQPGHFWINLRTPDLHRKYSLPDLTYHEAIPGHVWQGEYTFKQPLIRSLLAFNAYSEGWALYAEQIADELGVYDEFPVGRLGYLQSLAFRACRLVVDTGLHAKRWTREEAIDWFVVNNGSNPDEVQSEVDRYCTWPGQACGYKVGHSAVNQLRIRAMDALGDAYNFKRFNDALVLGGSVPMTVLGNVIDDYIAQERG